MSADLPSHHHNKPLTPEVTWAQRSSSSDASKNFVYLTILASDVEDKQMKLDIQPGSVTFKGYSTSKKVNYEVTLELFAEIDPKESKVHHSARDVEMKLQKKDLKEEYWPRLLKDQKKVHFLKTDFDKWVDEDEQDGMPEDDYMNQFGADGGFGGLDFSKLAGGAGGMPDLGDLAGAGAGADGSDDEEMGEDEDEDDDESGLPAKSGAKIEEVE